MPVMIKPAHCFIKKTWNVSPWALQFIGPKWSMFWFLLCEGNELMVHLGPTQLLCSRTFWGSRLMDSPAWRSQKGHGIKALVVMWPVGWTEAGYVWTDGIKISVINPIKSHHLVKPTWRLCIALIIAWHGLIRFFGLSPCNTEIRSHLTFVCHQCMFYITMICTMKAKWLFRWVSPESPRGKGWKTWFFDRLIQPPLKM